MRVRTIRWKCDPYDVFDRMRDEPWAYLNQLQRQGAEVWHPGLTWHVNWTEDEK